MGYFNNATLDAYESDLKLAYGFNEGNELYDMVGTADLQASGLSTVVNVDGGKYHDRLTFYDDNTGHFYGDTSSVYPESDFALSFWAAAFTGRHGGAFVFPFTLPGVVVDIDSSLFLRVAVVDDANEMFVLRRKVTSGSWFHCVVLTRDSYLYLFVDGKQVGNVKYSGAFRQFDSQRLAVGHHFEYKIDEIYFWKDISFANQEAVRSFVAALYNSGSGRFVTRLERSIAEAVALADDHTAGRIIAFLNAETLDLADVDTNTLTISKTLAETVAVDFISWYGFYEVVAETLSVEEVLTPNWEGARTVAETVTLLDEALVSWLKQVNESVSFADSLEYILTVLVREAVKLSETLTPNWDGSLSVAEGLHLRDSHVLTRIIAKLIEEEVSFSDALSTVISVIMAEYVQLTASAASSWEGAESVAESLYLADDESAVKLFIELVAEGLTIEDALTSLVTLVVKESVALSLTQTAAGTFSNSAEETLTIVDATTAAWLKEIQESLTLTDANTLGWVFLCQLAESVSFTDAVTPVRTTLGNISESVQMALAFTIQSTLQASISETLDLTLRLVIDGEVYQCWALNTSRFHPSVYSGFNFNSFAVYEGTTYAAKSDGIYEITGDDDDGGDIHSGIRLPDSTFGAANKKRLRRAYLGVSGTNPTIKVETDNGWKVYNVTSDKVNLCRDQMGKNFTIEVQDFETLDFVELVPVILAKTR